jgi:hypothetical protein
MAYWTVIQGGVTVYRGEQEPMVHSDGKVELPKGQTFEKDSYTLTGPHKGNPPRTSGKGSNRRSTGNQEKIDPARGYGEDNTK